MNKLVRHSKLFLKRNSATILTGVGVVGVVATAIVAVKATPTALLLLEAAEREKEEELTKWEVVKTAGPAYIPAVAIGLGTITCVIGANVLNKRQQAAVISAYALLERSYKEYKGKVVEMLGEDADTEIKTGIFKDKYDAEEAVREDNKELFYDMISERYFNSTLYQVQKAEYLMNRDIQMQGWVSLNDFYEYMNIDPIEGGDAIGWTEGLNMQKYWQSWVDFSHQKVVMDDGLECIVLSTFEDPILDFQMY